MRLLVSGGTRQRVLREESSVAVYARQARIEIRCDGKWCAASEIKPYSCAKKPSILGDYRIQSEHYD